jgi:NAD(P)-dependent dehydrogenase (short-subunit alcohol dehydrogenase family)
VALGDINKDAVESAAASLPGDKHIASKVDVTSNEQVEGWIKDIVQRFGKLDGAANVAGLALKSAPFIETTEDHWDLIMSWAILPLELFLSFCSIHQILTTNLTRHQRKRRLPVHASTTEKHDRRSINCEKLPQKPSCVF